MKGASFRLLLFGDSRSATSVALAGGALRAAATYPGVNVVAVVDVAHEPPPPLRLPRAVAAELGRHVFEPRSAAPGLRRELPAASLRRLARHHGVPVVRPAGGTVNDAAFVQRVREELRPDGALAVMVAQVFGRELLAACRASANYHDGLLPAYRGIAATAWSVYRGESRSGFTFHRMTAGVDEGPVLLEDTVEVPPAAISGQVQRAKTRLARTRMADAVARLADGDPGRAQEGPSSTFTRADALAIARVPDPTGLTWDDLQRRVRAFEMLRCELEGATWPVTGLRRVTSDSRHRPLAFTTADGVRAEPSRFVHLPLPLYRAYRAVRKP